ncbi:MAG: hypothetical protein ACI88A_003618 [Paraglaciecola sp.]|jgi:hypothetical protein
MECQMNFGSTKLRIYWKPVTLDVSLFIKACILFSIFLKQSIFKDPMNKQEKFINNQEISGRIFSKLMTGDGQTKLNK